MGFFDSLCSSISSACRSVCNAVSKVVDTAVELTNKVGSMAIEGLRGVASVITNIAQSLGFMKPNENPEELGDQIIQAEGEGITLESCMGDYEKYMEKIRNFKVDPDYSKKITLEDKLVATSVVMGSRIEQHYGQSIAPLIPLMARIPEFLKGGRLKSFLDAGISMLKIGDYFSSNLNRKESAPIEEILVKNEKVNSPDADEDKLRNMLRSMRE